MDANVLIATITYHLLTKSESTICMALYKIPMVCLISNSIEGIERILESVFEISCIYSLDFRCKVVIINDFVGSIDDVLYN